MDLRIKAVVLMLASLASLIISSAECQGKPPLWFLSVLILALGLAAYFLKCADDNEHGSDFDDWGGV